MGNALLRVMRPLDPEINRWLDTLDPDARAQALASLGAGGDGSAAPADFGNEPVNPQQNALLRAVAPDMGDQPSRTADQIQRANAPIDLRSLPTDQLRDVYHPNAGGFVRNETTGKTLFLNGQPNGISEEPYPQGGNSPMADLMAKFQGQRGAMPNPDLSGQGGPKIMPTGAGAGMMRVIGSGNGTTVDLGTEPDRQVSLDYSRGKIDIPGVGRAYYGKDGNAYVPNGDGTKTKVLLGYDMQGSMALNKAEQQRQLGQAQIEHTQEMTRASQTQNPDLRGGGGNAPAASGQALLQSLDPGIAAQVKAIAEGRQKPPAPIGGRISPLMTLVAQYDPSFDSTDYNLRFKTAQDYSSAGRAGQKVQAINQALHHAGQLSDAIDSLDNSNVLPAVVNPVKNWFEQKVGGDTRQGVFQTKANALAAELRKVYAGAGGGTLEELHKWEGSFDANAGQNQQRAYLKAGMQLLTGAIDSLRENYVRGMGQHRDFGELISPDARASMDKIMGGGKAPANPGTTKRVSSDADYQALSPGEQYVAPDGSVRTKRG